MAEQEKPNAPKWLKVLLFLHVTAITIWALPNPAPAAAEGRRNPVGTEWLLFWNSHYLKNIGPLEVYLLGTGFWQYWDMFSPNPSQTDIWVDAIVTYKNGKEKTYQYPRIFLMSIPQKFMSERYRKFYERVNMDQNPYLWAPFAQHIAWINDDPKNPPVTIKLRRHWIQIMGPGKKQWDGYKDTIYYEHAVDPKKLNEDRKGLF